MLCFETTVARLQAVTYFVSVVISFFVVVPVGITLRNFQGSCVLFAQVVWDGKTIWPWSETACDFVLYMNLAATLIYAFWMGIYSLWVAVPKRFPFAREHYDKLKALDTHEENFRIHGVNPVFMLINTIILFMVLSNAVIITVGLQRFCGWLVDAVDRDDVDTCADAQRLLRWEEFAIIRGETMGVKGDQFYTCLAMACIASWVLFLVWVFQWILNFSQSFTMCSCEVAEEKRRPDSAVAIAARRSRMATPIGTPGHMTPGGRYTPPVGAGQPMRPYNFGPPPRQQQQPQMQQPYMMRQPQQARQPMQLQQDYAPPRRQEHPQMAAPLRRSTEELDGRPARGQQERFQPPRRPQDIELQQRPQQYAPPPARRQPEHGPPRR